VAQLAQVEACRHQPRSLGSEGRRGYLTLIISLLSMRVVPWSEFPIVPSYLHYPQEAHQERMPPHIRDGRHYPQENAFRAVEPSCPRAKRVAEVDSSCRILIVPLFRGSRRFESLILSHNSRFTCECNKEEINDDDDDFGLWHAVPAVVGPSGGGSAGSGGSLPDLGLGVQFVGFRV